MQIHISDDLELVNWHELAKVFERAPLGTRQPDVLEQSFRNSQVVCFAHQASTIVGAGRALTDWLNWAVVFDLVLLPEYQGQGHGSAMLRFLVEHSKARNVMLHSTPGKEGFYARQGFRRMKTAMALYAVPQRAIDGGYIE